MTVNYSKGIPIGNNGVPEYQAPPAVRAVAANGSTNQVTSSVITLTQDTTAIEIAVMGTGGAAMKWISASDTQASVISVGAGANMDHGIGEDTVRRFVVPVETFPIGNFTYGNPSTVAVTSQVGANRENGLFRRVAIISAGGTSSVLVTEYGNFV